MDESDEELTSEVYGYSTAVFELAKAFLAGEEPGAIKPRALEMRAQLPELAARARQGDPELQPGFMKVLSEARVDLSWIASDGKLPSSIRIGHVIAEGAH